MTNRVDLITVNRAETALFVNETRLMTSRNFDDIEQKATQIAQSIGAPMHHYHESAQFEDYDWHDIAEVFYSHVKHNKREIDAAEQSSINQEIDAELERDLGLIAKDFKSIVLRSWQRLADFNTDATGKYLNTAIATIAGAFATHGALDGNAILSGYLSEIVATTTAAALTTVYGAGVAFAGAANRELVEKYPWYQQQVNDRLLARLDKMMSKEGVTDPNALTPRQKSQFFEHVKLNYAQATPELLTAFIELKTIADESRQRDNQHEQTIEHDIQNTTQPRQARG